MEQPELITPRLRLRRFRRDDADSVLALAGNYNVAKTTLRIPHPYRLEMAREWIAAQPSLYKSGTEIVFAISLKQSGDLIGAIGLRLLAENSGEFGYWIGEPFWQQGYCSEAAAAVRDFAFDQLSLQTLHAEHLQSNPASGRVMHKIGMRHIGSACKADRNQQPAEMEIYRIDKTTNDG